MAQLVEVLCYKLEGCGFDSLQFFIDIILPAAQGFWFDSASIRCEYQEYFLGEVNEAGI